MTKKNPRVSIATSLVPHKNIELQRLATQSWLDVGLGVISLNAEAEATQVAQQFPDITVQTTSRIAPKTVGKPLPFITDLLRAAAQHISEASVVGVINSDIFLRKDTEILSALLSENTETLTLLPRVDVPDVAALTQYSPNSTQNFSIGYDGVFMPPSLIERIPQNLFCIGMPFWDYWLPLVMLLQGVPVKTIASPVALHVSHTTQWDQSVYLFFHALISDVLKVSRVEHQKHKTTAFEIALDMLQHTYDDTFARATQPGAAATSIDSLASFYDRLQEVIVHHIKAKSCPVVVPDRPHAAP